MKKLYDFYDRHHYTIILILAVVFSICSLVYYYHSGLITAYPDAKGHLNIARRVSDNVTPGLAQLGGVWLPLFHILMLPTIWNDFMWHSGLSGSIVSIPAYILAVYFLYKLVYLVTESKFRSLIAFLLLALNINLLFLQATPMTEALFICTLVLSIYYLVKWTKNNNISYLLVAGLCIFLTSINRYEGWFVALCSVFVVGLLSFSKKGFKHAEGSTIIFSTIALFGIFMWFVWQAIIFHNPIYFLNSDFSAKGQTLVSIASGEVPTYKNWMVSALSAYYSLVHVNGIVLIALSLVGLIGYTSVGLLSHERRENFLKYLPLYLLLVPFGFLIFALYRGNIPLIVPEFQPDQSLPPQFFNIRYALYTLPAMAVFAVILPVKSRLVSFTLLVFAIINIYLLLPFHGTIVPTYVDAHFEDTQTIKAVNLWVKTNYRNGYILASAATSDPIIFGTGLHMSNFITEGSGKYWTESMKNPSKYATLVIIADSQRDMVNRYMNHNVFNSKFELAQEFKGFKIYKLHE